MNRGTVLELDGDTAVVLTPDGQFFRIKASGVSIGEEITWTNEALIGARRADSFVRRRRRVFAGASAAVLFLMFFALWMMRPPAVVAYVSMDINPSLELGLDAEERVLELRAVNKDAETVVQGISYRGEPVEEVMRQVGQKLASANFLGSGNEEIVIASVRVRSVDEEWEIQVTEKIKQILQQTSTEAAAPEEAQVKIETVSLPPEVRQEAIEKGISTGKMAIWLAAEKGGRSVPLDQVQNESVESISSSIGGLKQVLEESSIDKDNKDAWKQLLKEQKEKQEKEKEERKKQQEERKKQQEEQRKKQQEERKKQQEERKKQQEEQRKKQQEERKKQQEERKKQQEEQRKKQQEERKKQQEERKKQQEEQRKKQQEERKQTADKSKNNKSDNRRELSRQDGDKRQDRKDQEGKRSSQKD